MINCCQLSQQNVFGVGDQTWESREEKTRIAAENATKTSTDRSVVTTFVYIKNGTNVIVAIPFDRTVESGCHVFIIKGWNDGTAQL